MTRGHAEEARRATELPSALTAFDEITASLGRRRPAMFFDYDGTLTPIVSQPEDAILSDFMREALAQLSQLCTVAIVSGRDRADVEPLVSLDGLVYAGSHGFDIKGPAGLRLEHEGGRAVLADLDRAERELNERLETVRGARVERKRFAIANHYRNVAEADVPQVEQAVREVLGKHDRLRMSGGKKVYELRPDIDWEKGQAVLWLVKALGLAADETLAFYVGDDVTDEDAFRALAAQGVGIVVGAPAYRTHATYRLKDTDEVRSFLERMIRLLRGRQ